MWVQSALHPPNNSRDRSAIPKNDRWWAELGKGHFSKWMFVVYYKRRYFCFRNLNIFPSCPCIQWGTFWAANSAGKRWQASLSFFLDSASLDISGRIPCNAFSAKRSPPPLWTAKALGTAAFILKGNLDRGRDYEAPCI